MFKNLGSTALKFQFTIDCKILYFQIFAFFMVTCRCSISVKEVILPEMFDDFDGTETLCLAFERKNKGLTYTEEKRISLNDNDEIIADFTNESFTTDVTLYRDNKTGVIREKAGDISLLQRKYGIAGSTREAFKTIGVAHVPFHQFTDNQAHERELFFGGTVSHNARVLVVIAGVAKVSSTYLLTLS